MRSTLFVFLILTFISLNLAKECPDDKGDAEKETNLAENKLTYQANVGGVLVPEGMYGFLVFFLLKPKKAFQTDIENEAIDSSVGRFLCTGTLLNRRWALTKAKPLIYYKSHHYWLVAPGKFSPFKYTHLPKYEIEWVAFHERHMETGYLEYDVVFVRTTSDVVLSQSVRSVNVGITGVTIPYPDDAQDCRLVVWNFTKITTRSDKGLTVIHPAEIPIRFPADCRNGDKNYTDYNLYMNCIKQNLSESAFPFDQPCAMNLGAPVVCGIFQQLWGVFVGDDGISRCTGESFRGNDGEKEYDMINVHKPDEGYPIQNFIEVILNKAVYVNNLGEVLEHFNISADSGGKLDK